jgi:hypothetical protein
MFGVVCVSVMKAGAQIVVRPRQSLEIRNRDV